MRKLDVLLINPNNRSQIFQGLANDLAAVENPIWAGQSRFGTAAVEHVKTMTSITLKRS